MSAPLFTSTVAGTGRQIQDQAGADVRLEDRALHINGVRRRLNLNALGDRAGFELHRHHRVADHLHVQIAHFEGLETGHLHGEAVETGRNIVQHEGTVLAGTGPQGGIRFAIERLDRGAGDGSSRNVLNRARDRAGRLLSRQRQGESSYEEVCAKAWNKHG